MDFVDKTRDQCVAESLTKFMFRHLQPYFNHPISELLQDPQFRGIFDLQKLGTLKPNAPVLLNSNRYDPLVPYVVAREALLQSDTRSTYANEVLPASNVR